MLILSAVVSLVVMVVCLWLIYRKRPIETPPVVTPMIVGSDPLTGAQTGGLRILAEAFNKRRCQKEAHYTLIRSGSRCYWRAEWRGVTAQSDKARSAANRCFKAYMKSTRQGRDPLYTLVV